jgi:hypothetical protein
MAARVRDTGLAILEHTGLHRNEANHAWPALLAYTAGGAAVDSNEEDFDYGVARLLCAPSSRCDSVWLYRRSLVAARPADGRRARPGSNVVAVSLSTAVHVT